MYNVSSAKCYGDFFDEDRLFGRLDPNSGTISVVDRSDLAKVLEAVGTQAIPSKPRLRFSAKVDRFSKNKTGDFIPIG